MTIEKTCWDKTWKGTNKFLVLIRVMNGLDITTHGVGIEMIIGVGIS
jgi:hypothetical protein